MTARAPKPSLLKRPLLLAALAAVVAAGGLLAAPQSAPANTGQAVPAKDKPKEKEKVSFFTDLWHLDKEQRAGRPWVTFHRTNYALAFSYNSSPTWPPGRPSTRPRRLSSPRSPSS